MKAKGEYRPAIRPIPPADEQVAAILSDGERRFEEMSLSREERARLTEMRRKAAEKKRKEREKARERSKVTFDIPPLLKTSLDELADKEGVTVSQVITFLLFEALERFDKGEISFWGCKERSQSPRYDWILVHPKDTERMEKIESRKNKKSQ